MARNLLSALRSDPDLDPGWCWLQGMGDVDEDLSWLWDDPDLEPDLFDDPLVGDAATADRH